MMMMMMMSNWIANLVFAALLFQYKHHGSVVALSPPSPLTNTKWKLRLDVGFQQGSWMPKRFPGWAESGARLPIDVDVEFTTQPSSQRERLVGPKDSTYALKVCGGPSTFVSEKGQEDVTFTNGGWCIKRPTGNMRNAEGSLVKPEGLLCFWLDCPSGAKKRDAEIFPDTRIFFTTGVWDDPPSLGAMQSEYDIVVEELQSVVDETREIRQEKEQEGSGNNNLRTNVEEVPNDATMPRCHDATMPKDATKDAADGAKRFRGSAATLFPVPPFSTLRRRMV